MKYRSNRIEIWLNKRNSGKLMGVWSAFFHGYPPLFLYYNKGEGASERIITYYISTISEKFLLVLKYSESYNYNIEFEL